MDDNTRIDGDDATRSVQVLDGGVNLLGLGATALQQAWNNAYAQAAIERASDNQNMISCWQV